MVKILSILLILLAIIAITYGRSAEYKIAINQRVNIGANANSEDDNTGEDNTGKGNTGEGNTGEDSTDEGNTSEDNTGQDNTGEDNTGEDNTGEDNTGEGDIDGVKNLQELTEENIGVKQELNKTKILLTELTEENNGVKQELNETKILLTDLTEENNGVKQELNETKTLLTELTEENIGIKQELNETKQFLVAMEKKFDNYKAETDSRLSEFSELFDELNLVRSCGDVPKAKGTTRNGSYSITPDPSLPPFDVECSFNGNTATTTIHHNSEEEIEVSGDCDPAKCYGRNIVYDATIPQIRALISLDGKCRQYIKYRCHHSRIFRDNNYAGWETWNGTMRHYWGGSGGRDGYCACGITGTCADTNYKCNCDANDIVWREDSGFLDQDEDLPATKVYFGDVDGSNEHGHHTLGSLQCQQSL